MENAKVYKIGKHKGTSYELTKIVGITHKNMENRIEKWLEGKYTAEKCMTIGKLSTKKPEECGNEEWDSLSRYIKDARKKLSDIKINWIY